jgi:protocatechuate 3,4-dioxygenase beta subunit
LGLGAAAATLAGGAAAQATPAVAPQPVRLTALDCHAILSPEEIEGPYYIDGEQIRSDITEGKPGVPVTLNLRLVDVNACQALANASVAVWHCDALGYYSGFTANDPDTPAGGDGGGPTDDYTFCRGVQVSGADGRVQFRTLYPGWYYGRAIHIHVKVYAGGSAVHTGQLYFQETLTQQVARQYPYNTHTFQRWTNDQDEIYVDEGGAQSVLATSFVQPGNVAAGLIAAITLGIDPNAWPGWP